MFEAQARKASRGGIVDMAYDDDNISTTGDAEYMERVAVEEDRERENDKKPKELWQSKYWNDNNKNKNNEGGLLN